MNESTVKAAALSKVQEDWVREHQETDGQHHGMIGPGTSSWSNCVICNPPRPMTEMQREDLRDEIELDLL